MGWTLLELHAETGVEKRTIHKILKEDLHLRKIAYTALTEVDRHDVQCHLLFLFFKICIIHKSKSIQHHPPPFVYFHVSSSSNNLVEKIVAMA